MTNDDYRLKTPDVMSMAGCSWSYLAKKRADGTGPRFIRLGHKTIRYSESSVRAWVASMAGGGK